MTARALMAPAAGEIIGSYDGIVRAFIEQRRALGLTQLELDERTGWPSGYCGKLESYLGPQGRVAGAISFPLWFEATGLRLVPLIVEPIATARPKLSIVDLHRRPRAA